MRRTDSLRDEVVGLLQELIRLDTVNPPGNETQAAELLRGYLAESGVAVELYAKVPERANLVARIPGSGDGPSLMLLSHTDTVVADPADWQVDPWSGELREGEIWGRGALDMKGQVAASAVAIASLAREGFQPAGDLVFAACADEEVGEGFGLPWLCEAHPDAVRTARQFERLGGIERPAGHGLHHRLGLRAEPQLGLVGGEPLDQRRGLDERVVGDPRDRCVAGAPVHEQPEGRAHLLRARAQVEGLAEELHPLAGALVEREVGADGVRVRLAEPG